MNCFVLTPAARADLLDIFDYISQDNPDAARRVLHEIRAAMRKLAEMPEMGHFRRDLATEPLRFWQAYSYLIIYRSEAKPLQVVRVLHSARDVRQILEDIG
jgi:plasmid stabilization system protein ParE